MFIRLLGFLALFSCAAAFADSRNAPIKFRNPHQDQAKFSQIIRDRILSDSNKRYSRVQAKVEAKSGKNNLTVHLVEEDNYSFETALILLDKNNNVEKIQRNFTPVPIRFVPIDLCPDKTVDVVFATPCDWINTAVVGVESACASAQAAGYSCRTLIGEEASLDAYKRWMSCPDLKGFGNIGHGNINGILLADDEVLSSTYFDGMTDTALQGSVLYYNSCQVHNNPLEPSIMSAGTRTFIGGNVNLGIGTSEEVFKCFWRDVLSGLQMGSALSACEGAHYPTAGAHGISGATGLFKPMTPIPRPTLRPVPPRPIPRPIPRPVPTASVI